MNRLVGSRPNPQATKATEMHRDFRLRGGGLKISYRHSPRQIAISLLAMYSVRQVSRNGSCGLRVRGGKIVERREYPIRCMPASYCVANRPPMRQLVRNGACCPCARGCNPKPTIARLSTTGATEH
jgi:hypothetical protein